MEMIFYVSFGHIMKICIIGYIVHKLERI